MVEFFMKTSIPHVLAAEKEETGAKKKAVKTMEK